MKRIIAISTVLLFFINAFAQNHPKFYQYKSKIPDHVEITNTEMWYIYRNFGVEKYSLDGNLIESHDFAALGFSLYITCSHIDDNGNLWVGTSDGVAVLSVGAWQWFAKDNSSMGDDDVNVIASKGNDVWIGTEYGGAILFRDFVITTTLVDEIPISDKTVASIFIDNSDNVWIGLDNYFNGGVIKYNGTNVLFWDDAKGAASGQIDHIIQGVNDTMWFATRSAGLLKLDESLDTLITYSVAEGFVVDDINDLLIDAYDTLWIATDGGLAKYDATTNKIINYSTAEGFEYGDGLKLATDGENIFIGYNDGFAMFDRVNFSNYSDVYATTGYNYSNGIDELIFENGKLYQYGGQGAFVYENNELSLFSIGLSAKDITAVEVDNNGNTWFGVYRSQIQMLDQMGKWHHFSRPLGDVRFYTNRIIIDEKTNDIWFATDKGIIINSDGVWTTITQDNFPSLPSNKIFDVTVLEDGTYWVGTAAGAAYFNGTVFNVYTTTDGLPYEGVGNVEIANDGIVWMSTSGYNSEENQICNFDGTQWTVFEKTTTFEAGYCNDIVINGNDVWFSADSKTSKLFKFDGTEWTNMTSFLGMDPDQTTSSVKDLEFDANGILWGVQDSYGSSENGIFSFDGENWHFFTENNNLITAYQQDIAIDLEGNIWIGTQYNGAFFMDQPLKISFITDTVCQGTATTFTATTEPVTSWSWDVMDDGAEEGAESNFSYVFPEAGTFDVKFSISDGKDTNWVVKQVEVLPLPDPVISSSTPNAEICDGDVLALGVEEFVSYNWSNGSDTKFTTVKDGNLHSVTVTGDNGCKNSTSIVTTFHELPQITISSSDDDNIICLSDEVTFTTNEFATYLWSDHSTLQTITVSESGEYSVTVTDINDCKNSESVELKVIKSIESSITETACGNYTWIDDITYTESNNNLIYTLTSTAGCDSVVTLNLTINPIYNSTTSKTTEFGGSYTFGTQTLTENGMYTEVFQTVRGCDSTVVLNFTVEDPLTIVNEVTEVACGSFDFGDETITESGEYKDTIYGGAVTGADSIVILSLTINPVYNEVDEQTVAFGDSFVFGTQTLRETGEYTVAFQSKTGCDSIVVLTFTVEDPLTIVNEVTEVACGSFDFSGETITESGEYKDTIYGGAVTGADSIIILTLIITPEFNEAKTKTVAFGESFVFGTQTLTKTGEYTEVFQSITGCDSTVTLTFTILADNVLNQGDTISIAIEENPTIGDIITTLPDTTASGDTLQYTLSDTTNFTIDDNQLVIKNSSAFNAEVNSALSVVVFIENGDQRDSALIIIPILDVNEVPEIATGGIAIIENSDSASVITELPLTDQDGDILTYTLVDSSIVTLEDGKLIIANSSAFNAEGDAITIQLIVNDGIYIDTIPVTVSVINVNEFAPVFTTSIVAFSIAENLSNGSAIVTIEATDADGETLSYSITETDSPFFIDEASGVITVADETALDYETISSFIITVEVSDGENIESLELTITLTNVVEGTALQTHSQSTQVYPNVTVGHVTIESATENAILRIASQNGVIVYEGTISETAEFDFSNYTNGIYTVQIINSSEVFTAKVCVVK